MIKILLECFNFIKQLIESSNKKDFISKNSNMLKNCLIVFLCILLIIIVVLYTINLIKKPTINNTLLNNNNKIIIQLEIPSNINGPINLKLSKSS